MKHHRFTETAKEMPPRHGTRQALRRVWPTALAVIPIGMLFGILACQAKWSAIEVLLISLLGFSGSAQFAVLPLASKDIGFITMLLVAISINCRYLPIALVGASRLPSNHLHRLYLSHLLGDEAYALEQRQDGDREITVIRSAIFISWVLSATAGALVGSIIPERSFDPNINLGFPASLVLFHLSCSQLRARYMNDGNRRRLQLAGYGLCAAVATVFIALLGSTYFWVPSIVVCGWILWRLHA